jgi:hypothetical protein
MVVVIVLDGDLPIRQGCAQNPRATIQKKPGKLKPDSGRSSCYYNPDAFDFH